MTTVKFQRYSPVYNADENRCEWHWFDDEAPAPRAALESLRSGEWLRWDPETERAYIDSLYSGAVCEPDGVYLGKANKRYALYYRPPAPAPTRTRRVEVRAEAGQDLEGDWLLFFDGYAAADALRAAGVGLEPGQEVVLYLDVPEVQR